MTFGPLMQVAHAEFEITLAPLRNADMPQIVEGLSRASVTQYTTRLGLGYTAEDGGEFFERMRKAEHVTAWGIYLRSGRETLAGVTECVHRARGPMRVGTTGSMLYDPATWGRGVATACHRARTWYLFAVLGLDALRSEHVLSNEASGRALAGIGSVRVGLQRNVEWYRGAFQHLALVECVNPSDAAWARWWGDDPVPPEFVAARERTRAALEWAEQHVTLL
ncbi:GNAT family N-acetyltransferase [Micrococcales bacterium 31B]|nr:GNAT family N-acetyltransferase [Micrococcales bacterium 31B]